MNEYVAMAFDALWGLVVKSEIIKKFRCLLCIIRKTLLWFRY